MKKSYTFLLITLLFFFFFLLQGSTHKQNQIVLSVDKVPISYSVKGNGKPALVFVHGWCCDKTYWKFQVPYFSKQYEVVTIDLGGHGKSGFNRKIWTIEAFGKDVAVVIEKLGLNQIILIGHSMGGPVIIDAARQMPNKNILGLVGVDTFQDIEIRYSQEQIDKYISPFKINFSEATRNFVRSMFSPQADSALVNQIVTDMSSAPPEVGIGAMQGLFRFDQRKSLKNLRIPIYCINADKYPTNIEAGQRYAFSFKVKLMPGLGHFVMLEDPKKFNQLLSETIAALVK